jgi:hypothetical protein
VPSAPPLRRPHALARAKDDEASAHQRQLLASRSVFAVGPSHRPRDSHGARRLALRLPDDRTPSSPSVPRLAPTAEPEARYGPSLPFTLTAIWRRASPVEDARPNRTRARAIAFWLVPLTMTTQLNSRFLGSSATRDPRATAAFAGLAPFRTEPSAVCCVGAPGRGPKPGPRRRAPVDHF